jgi:hypothetical protein
MGCGASKANATTAAVVHIASKADSVAAADEPISLTSENSRHENPYAFEAGDVQAAHVLFAPDDGHIHPAAHAEVDDVSIPLANATDVPVETGAKVHINSRSSMDGRYGVIGDVQSVRPVSAAVDLPDCCAVAESAD